MKRADTRHAEPTSAQILRRLYRRQIASDKRLKHLFELYWIDRQTMRSQSLTLKTLTDHCARLLREKDTLAKIVARYQGTQNGLRQANDFMSHLTRRANGHATPCGFVSTHRPGIPCGICGAV